MECLTRSRCPGNRLRVLSRSGRRGPPTGSSCPSDGCKHERNEQTVTSPWQREPESGRSQVSRSYFGCCFWNTWHNRGDQRTHEETRGAVLPPRFCRALTLRWCRWVRPRRRRRRATARRPAARCCGGWAAGSRPGQSRRGRTTPRSPSCSPSNRCTLDVAVAGSGTEGRGRGRVRVRTERSDRAASAPETGEEETTTGGRTR